MAAKIIKTTDSIEVQEVLPLIARILFFIIPAAVTVVCVSRSFGAISDGDMGSAGLNFLGVLISIAVIYGIFKMPNKRWEFRAGTIAMVNIGNKTQKSSILKLSDVVNHKIETVRWEENDEVRETFVIELADKSGKIHASPQFSSWNEAEEALKFFMTND